MIYPGPLTLAQQESSQRNYNIFSSINGLSYMCLGETVILLLAIRIGCPDYFISALGAMIYFGFLLLPLGKIVTARIGAAQAQATFWVMRNMAALIVASSAVFSYFGMMLTAMALLLIGAFLFYGFRAAGVVMSQPLIGDITSDLSRPRVIAISIGRFYVSCIIALLTISMLLQINQSIWMLTGIIIAGAILGVSSARFIRRIDETENLRNSARRPIGKELTNAFHDVNLRRLLLVGFMVNLGTIMLVPISMLVLKRGYGVSDTGALLFALAQFSACAIMSFLSGKISSKIGPRKTTLYSYIIMLTICLLWLFAPVKLNAIYMLIPFIIAGGSTVCMSNALTHYFLQTTADETRVASSMFLSVTNGAGAGILGMLLGGILLKWCVGNGEFMLHGYHMYFIITMVLLLPGLWVIYRLTPLPLEKRKIKKTWNEVE